MACGIRQPFPMSKLFLKTNVNPKQRKLLISTLRQSDIAMEKGPGLKMYFLLKMGIFQPAILVLLEGRGVFWNSCAGLATLDWVNHAESLHIIIIAAQQPNHQGDIPGRAEINGMIFKGTL